MTRLAELSDLMPLPVRPDVSAHNTRGVSCNINVGAHASSHELHESILEYRLGDVGTPIGDRIQS